MLTLSHSNAFRSSLTFAALLTAGLSLSPVPVVAADELVNEGLSQIVTDEAADRLSRYLETYGIDRVRSIVVEGQFRTMTDVALSQKLTDSLLSREIVIDENAGTSLTGQILLSESEQSSFVVMQCTLTDTNDGDLCTIRIRKVVASEHSL